MWWLLHGIVVVSLLSTRYIRAGATTDANGWVFYTLDVRYIFGDSSSKVAAAGTLPPGTTATPLPTVEPFILVNTVTPAADGQIIHVVKPGQSLNAIADAYGITLNELKELNNLIGDLIYPDDELLIRPAFTSTPTQEPSSVPSLPPPTSTRRPTRTPTPKLIAGFTQPVASKTASSVAVVSSPVQPEGDVIGDILIGAVIFLVVVGAGMVAVGSRLKRNA